MNFNGNLETYFLQIRSFANSLSIKYAVIISTETCYEFLRPGGLNDGVWVTIENVWYQYK